MSTAVPTALEQALTEKLADSLMDPLPVATPRRLFGRFSLPGKATAVIGMRRVGKTSFLHQRMRERMELGSAREALPYINFEDERLGGLKSSQLGFLIEEYRRRFPGATKRLLTLTRDGSPAETPPDVIVQPACDWMLTEPDDAS